MTSSQKLSLSRRGFMAGAGTLAIAPPAISLPAAADDVSQPSSPSTTEQELLDVMRIRPASTTFPLPSNQMVARDAVSLTTMILAAERMVDIISRRAEIGPGSPARTRALLMLLRYVHRDVGLPALMPDFVHRVELAAHYLSHRPDLIWPGTTDLAPWIEPGRALPLAPPNTFPSRHTRAVFTTDETWQTCHRRYNDCPSGPVVWQSDCGRNQLHAVDSPMGVYVTGVETNSPIAYQFANPPIRTSAFRYPDDLEHLLFWRFIASGAYALYAFKVDGRTSGYFAVCAGTLFDSATNRIVRGSARTDFVRSMSVATRDHGPLLSCPHKNPHLTLEPAFSDMARTQFGAPWPEPPHRFVIPRDRGEVV
ncbi:exported hypothetical protein [Hyphomicrobium sp. GJ21]|uniref:hypothetical protein n=1 Tax=Hyphomicrobium sp. GJ21 TaxID=113574 RepID=UPI000622BA6C|nr:hypothetical protein [Hyphomicrobium sp. GJ21]CEJ87911.1 exported hypothetical protein [Hyphomicrobium sp. GJ21]